MRIFKVAVAALVVTLGMGFAGQAKAESMPDKDIVDTAVSAGSFKTLVAAAKAAGLVDTLKGEGPLTVLEPPQTVLAKKLGFRTIADGVELGIPFLQGGLVTRRSYIRANEDVVRRTVRVIVEAIHFAKTNKEAAVAVLKKYLHIQEREALEDAYESFVVKQFPKAPYVLPAAVQTIFDIAATRDPRAKSVDPQGFVEMRFVRELDQSGAIEKLYATAR